MGDPSWLVALRVLHVIFGVVTFVMAPAALLTAKGGRAHRLWGQIYFWSMVAVSLSAIAASLWRPNYFLLFVSIFAFYLAFSGYRAQVRKRRAPAAADWLFVCATLVVNLLLLVLGLAKPGPVWESLGPVAVAFGAAGVVVAGRDLRALVAPPADRQSWWYSHMFGMIGSYICALSAFSVTTMSFLPALVRWLWPTVVGLPLMLLWIRHYRRKFNPAPR